MGRGGLSVLRAAAADAPRQAGVYLFLDGRNDVLYVGKAGNLRQRLRQHAATGPSESRLYQRYDLVRRVVWEIAADEEAAVWREAELIFALRPPFNANPGLRAADPVGKDAQVPYIVVGAVATGMLSFTLEPVVPPIGRAYGCFPHLGKGRSGQPHAGLDHEVGAPVVLGGGPAGGSRRPAPVPLWDKVSVG